MVRVSEQYAGTDTGRQRRANEDALLARPPLFVVADGMGGARAGEVASRIAIESFRSGPEAAGEIDAGQALRRRIEEANARIHELSRRNVEQAGMGTTLTALLVGSDDVTLAHVGDSRAYLLRDGRLSRLTEDHSLVDELIRQGKITPEEAQEHPQRSVITRALGPEPEVRADVRVLQARAGDVYMLCSDGLTTMLEDSALERIIASHGSLRAAGEALLQAANEAGGRDNITVILLRLEDDRGAPAATPSERLQPMAALSGGGEATDADALPRTNGLADTGEHRAQGAPIPGAGRSTLSRPARLLPRAPARGRSAPSAPRRARLLRRLVPAAIVLLALLGVLAAGGYLASQSVYFLGTNGRGLLTIYSGLPYDLPGGLGLYSKYYVSGVPAGAIAPARRRRLLDNSWRSQESASALVREIELEAGGVR